MRSGRRCQHEIDFVDLILSRDGEGIVERALGRKHSVELSLEFEQVPFAGKELAPVERDDGAELALELLAGGPGVDLGDGQLDRFADVAFFGLLGSVKRHRALEALAVHPLGEANLPDISLRSAHLPDATLLVL